MSHPSLRFTTFVENGSDWKTVQLSEVATYITTRKSVESDSLYVGTDYLIKNFGGLDKSTKKSITGISFEKNDILLSNIRPYLKKLWISDESGICSADVLVIRSKTIEPVFFKYLLSTDEFFNHIAKGYQGSKMPRGDKKQIATFKFSMPSSYKEQQKIAAFFMALDEKIQIQNKLLSQYINLKKSLFNKYLLSKESSDITLRSLSISEAGETITGYPFNSKEFSQEGIRLIKGANVKRGNLDFSKEISSFWKTTENLEKYILQEDDLLIQMDGAQVGKSFGFVQKENLPAMLVQRVTRIRCSRSNAIILYQNLCSGQFNKFIEKRLTNTAVPHISLKDINAFTFNIPEQKEVLDQFSDIFDNIEKKILIVKQRLCCLDRMKKAFMQQMFV